MKRVVLVGAGNHAKVIVDIIKKQNDIQIIGATEKKTTSENNFVEIIGNDNILEELLKSNKADHAIIAVGSTGDNSLRKDLYQKTKKLGYNFINAIHFNSTIADSAQIGIGNVIMAGSVINPDVKIGDNNIINTNSTVEHDVVLENHIHISPGVTLAGGVKIGELSHIGLGANIIENIEIGKNCLIGAGSVVIDDIPDNSVVVGNPGKIIKRRE